MDLHDDNNTSDRNNETRRPRDERSNDRSGEESNNVWSFGNVGMQNTHTTLGGVNAAVVKTFEKALDLAGKDNGSSTRPEWNRDLFKLVEIPSGRNSTVPSMAVALPATIGGRKLTFAYVLLFETATQQLRRPAEDRQHERYDSLVLPEDTINTRYAEELEKRLKHLGGAVNITGQQVIPNLLVSKLDPSRDETHLIAPILDNAFNAICTFYEQYERQDGNSAAGIRITPDSLQNGMRLEAVHSFDGQVVTDTGLLPIANNIRTVISLSSPDDQDKGQYIRQELLEVLCSVQLFVTSADPYDDDYSLGRRDRDTVRPFLQPVININAIRPMDPSVPFNLAMVMIALNAVTNLTNRMAYARALVPRPGAETNRSATAPLLQLKYLPTLNPDVRDQPPVDLPPNLTDADLRDFLEDHLVDRVVIAMTIPVTGDRAWILKFFTMLSRNDEKFNRFWEREANTLTGGKWSQVARQKNLSPEDALVDQIATKELIGHWTDDNGNIRSLGEFNVATLRSYLGDRRGAEEVAHDYQRTFEDRSKSLDHNLSDRYDILARVVRDPRVVATGDQIVFPPRTLDILSEAMSEARMDAIVVSNDQGLQQDRPRAVNYGAYGAKNLGSSSRRERQQRSGRGSYDLSDDSRYYDDRR